MSQASKSNCEHGRPYRLDCQVQHYEWGARGDRAYISHLIGKTAEEDLAYAELWMGAHPNAQSMVISLDDDKLDLASWISQDPESSLGQETNLNHSGQLPYLFKVLSAEKALSIQAHPNRDQAKRLHLADPQHYPDTNHKPEIAIALDFLDALVGFISHSAFVDLLDQLPPLKQLLSRSSETTNSLENAVKYILQSSTSNSEVIKDCLTGIHQHIRSKQQQNDLEQLFLSEYEEYGPSDVGLLFLFLLNRIRLSPGEAIFLPPGVPHAYLKGNIVECMANSDNVVRLGLTPKFCDAPTLKEILDFSQGLNYSVETSSDGFLTEYLTPAKEFRVKSLALLEGESRAFSYRSGLTMFLVVEGETALKWGDDNQLCSCMYRRGNVFIVPATLSQFTIHSKSHCKLFLVDIPV